MTLTQHTGVQVDIEGTSHKINGDGDDQSTDYWNETSVESVAKLWDLSAKEREALIGLGTKLSREYDNHRKTKPSEIVRFSRARPNDVKGAEDMFRNMMEWRQEHHVDTILQDYTPPPELFQKYPGAVLQGVDRDGDPIYVGRVGVTDGVGMLRKYGHDEIIKHAIWVREMVSTGSWIQDYENQGVNEAPRTIKRITIIEDCHGISLSTHLNRQLLNAYSDVMRLDQDNYPETAKRLLIIRTPVIFRLVWSIIKHFFDKGVVDKMIFVGSSDYQEVLSQYVDLGVLPDEIVPGIGKGAAIPGMPPNFGGGPIEGSANRNL